jgi:hypothetical protein
MSFAGVEAVTDWASTTPVVIIPEVVLAFGAGEGALRVGLGTPIDVNGPGGTAVGAVLTLMLELDRD